jgi:hypothetical protein
LLWWSGQLQYLVVVEFGLEVFAGSEEIEELEGSLRRCPHFFLETLIKELL